MARALVGCISMTLEKSSRARLCLGRKMEQFSQPRADDSHPQYLCYVSKIHQPFEADPCIEIDVKSGWT